MNDPKAMNAQAGLIAVAAGLFTGTAAGFIGVGGRRTYFSVVAELTV